jgi:serine/threonine protein kinase
MIDVADRTSALIPTLLKKKGMDPQAPLLYPRTLLLTPNEGNYALLTSVTHRGDRKLGSSLSKTVKCAVDLSSGELCALGIVYRKRCSPIRWEKAKAEIETMRALKGREGIAQIKTSYIIETGNPDTDKIYVVMEFFPRDLLAVNRDLFTRNPDAETLFQESALRQIMLDSATGLESMHHAGWMHRDLKPENIFIFTDEQDRSRAKIGDFDHACRLDDVESFKEACGSFYWISPERAQVQILFPPSHSWEITEAKELATATITSQSEDVWSLGLIYYTLLARDSLWCCQGGGELAYHTLARVTQDAIDAEVIRGLAKRDPLSPFYSNAALLIRGMLRVNPSERLDPSAVKNFIQSHLIT